MCKFFLIHCCVLICASHVFAEQNLATTGDAKTDITAIEFDFTDSTVARKWKPLRDISSMETSSKGLVIQTAGDDPYLIGPPRDYPEGTPLWISVRLKSECSGEGEFFYFRQQSSPDKAVRFSVRAGEWIEKRVPLPPLGKGFRLRFDPPAGVGKLVLAKVRIEPRIIPPTPTWPAFVAPILEKNFYSIKSGDLELRQDRKTWGGLAIHIDGKAMAVGQTRPMIGYFHGRELRWIDLTRSTEKETNIRQRGKRIDAQLTCTDADGARWNIEQRFAPGSSPGMIEVECKVEVSRDRCVAFVPMIMLFPGVGTFGTNKTQALFPGLEYLENEPSSSEADLIGPASKRQVPDTLKITFPLMAIQTEGRYLGLIWKREPFFSALFDSPDRLFGSGGHVFGVLFPGSNGENREEGSLLPYAGEWLHANKPIVLQSQIIGGKGDTVIPAVQQYVTLKNLPSVPKATKFSDYVSLTAGGWLDSKIREGNLFRHAIGGKFEPRESADAALFMDWLGVQTKDKKLASRLSETARDALAQVPTAKLNSTSVGHVRHLAPSLSFGHVVENADQAEITARKLLSRFDADCSIRYRAPADGRDYGKTHFSDEASGLTAHAVMTLLEAAVFSGNKELIDEALKRLRSMDKFHNGVPRGAQTWEIPLHTPDILASAYMVRAYTLGFELTGEPQMLDEAKYWAWTGVPFIYLENPTTNPIGLYNTIPVLGATAWIAPVWIGRPVQWCGIVYADALYRFTRHDPTGPWQKLADGITAAGIRHAWPRENAELQGLLPDSFDLREQLRIAFPINPGTVQAAAVHFFRKPALHDFQVFRRNQVLVHAPGDIVDRDEKAARVQFTVNPWTSRPCFILVTGFDKEPRVRINGNDVLLNSPNEFSKEKGRLILQIRVKSHCEIVLRDEQIQQLE